MTLDVSQRFHMLLILKLLLLYWISSLDQTIMEEPSMLAASTMEGSRTMLDETVMPPPSTPRGVKRKNIDKEASLPVSDLVLDIQAKRMSFI